MKRLLAIFVVLGFLIVTLAPEIAEARRSCPRGWVKRGNKCYKYRYKRRYKKVYKCPSGCWYIGNGKCRCRRRR